MTSVLSYRPSTSGTSGTHNSNLNSQGSPSSFPSSRTPSNPSIRNGIPAENPPPLPYQGSPSRSRTPSTPSSIKPSAHRKNTTAHRGRLKSQYPADSPERHVEYILVAAFHVDQGPIMEHQYPGAISGDENMLAELMLPDQAHMRNQDWTIFFLHKDTGEGSNQENSTRTRNKERKPSGEDQTQTDGIENGAEDDNGTDADLEEDPEGGEGPPLIYVLNLVNTKQDNTAKRGAVVKAMAICTRHSFLHIYKPLLLLALEEYFKSPFPETLAALFDAVNSMDLSLMPRLSSLERHILSASDTKDLFIERFEQMIQQRMAEDSGSNSVASPDSLSKSTPEILRPGARYVPPRDTHEFESRVVYNHIPVPIKVPTSLAPETVGDPSLIKLIQAFSAPHAASPQAFTLHAHLTTCGPLTHPIIVLINALLTQKRIIFLGHNRPSGEVAEAVLAACALASGTILRGFTRHAFPYTDLSKINDLLNVPGFIAGVTNPIFANNPEWWDVLCDVPTGRMKISPRIEPAPITDGFLNFQQQHPNYAPNHNGSGPSSSGPSAVSPSNDPTNDALFITDILTSITSRHGESVIRHKFRQYITRFTRIAAAFEESVYGASALYVGASDADAGTYGVKGHGYVWADEQSRARELGANIWRIEGWRNTRSYYAFIQDLAAAWERRPIRNMDLAHQHDRLRSLKLSHDDSAAIYQALSACVHDYDDICQLLTVTPESNAGLFYLSLGLFHPEKRVRQATVELLERIMAHDAGRHFWARVGGFAKMGFSRVKMEMGANGGGGGSPVDGVGEGAGLDARLRGGK